MPHAPGSDGPSLQSVLALWCNDPSDSEHCLHLDDVLLSGDLITISFRHFKHTALKGRQSLHIEGACSLWSSIYVAAFLRVFLRARGAKPALMFAYPDGSPMLRREFDVALMQLLVVCGYQTSAFKGHRFRIGAATAAALRGRSDAQIRAAGRWPSYAFR